MLAYRVNFVASSSAGWYRSRIFGVMDVQKLPKVELHVHLDCSVSFKAAQALQPSLTRQQFRDNFVAPPKCNDLADYLTRADQGIRLMQSQEALRVVTRDLFRQFQRDHVLYAEIRLAPLLHLQGGLTPEQVAETVLEAGRKGEQQTGIAHRFIFCTLRRFSEAQSMQTVKLVQRYQEQGVGGFDIAGNESGYPLDAHLPAFAFAHQHGIPVTMHAGEAVGAESVRRAVTEGLTMRLGHGVRAIEDPQLLEELKSHKVHFEICPTSNIQTNVFRAMPEHPVDRLYRAGHSLSINTDGRTLSHVTLTDEYRTLQRVFGWQAGHFLRCNQEALRVAFLPEAERSALRQKLSQSWRRYS